MHFAIKSTNIKFKTKLLIFSIAPGAFSARGKKSPGGDSKK
tara:strand:+ start:347 stop:469 length:123 start_codon:yes stop_codon:yes gene_type:complete